MRSDLQPDPRPAAKSTVGGTLRATLPGTLAVLLILLVPGLAACGAGDSPSTARAEEGAPPNPENLAKATFAGGCFWCMEPPFDALEGVVSTTSGYTGGSVENPSYEQVSAGGTGHRESIQVLYDPERVSYGELLDVYWHNIDPTDPGGQFCDRGHQYTTAIFVHGEEQRRLAESSKAELEASDRFEKPLATEIVDAGPFYAAEGYHQDYYKKNPIRYKLYRTGCGRDRRLREIWGEEAGGH
jgi:peptide-methionine (S)-S-oxide reductase